MDSLTFLGKTTAIARPLPLYVVYGDEDFLKRQVLQALRSRILGADADEEGLSVHAGDRATFAPVHDELETVPFFSKRRLVIVENADPFVTRNRAALEDAVGRLPNSATLVLEVKSWPATTRLYKLVGPAATIECTSPAAYKLPAWCVQWASAQHGKQLTPPASELLVEYVGAEMGLLDQELLKLAVYVASRPCIEAEDVDRLVGNSQAQDVWKIVEAIGGGRQAEALGMLDRLLDQGEEPLRIVGALSMQLRRLVQVMRLREQGMAPLEAMAQAGVRPQHSTACEQQLRHLGRRRLDRVYHWLLEVNMNLRGDSPLPPRALLERLVIDLTRQRPDT